MRRWGYRGLLTSWAVYWLGLIGMRLGTAIAPIWTATHSAANGTVSVSAGSGALSLVVTTGAATTYSTTIGMLPLVLWVALPPLALWFAWFASRPSSRQPAELHVDRPALPTESAIEFQPRGDATPVRRRRQ